MAVGGGRPARPLPRLPRAEREICFEPQDRADLLGLGLLVERPRRVHVAVVGDCQAVHAELLDVRDELGDPAGPVEQRVFAVGVEVDEGHSGSHESRSRESRVGCNPATRDSRPATISPCAPAPPTRRPAGHRELQQHQKMIEEIGRLGRETLGPLRIRRDDDFDGLLAHLLRDFRHAGIEQLDRVRARRTLRRPAGEGGGQAGQEVGAGPSGEAAPAAGVARGPRLFHPVQDRIAVAVHLDIPHRLDVAGAFPLAPQCGPRPAVVVRLARGGGPLQRLTVGIREHQNVARPAFLRHHGHQAIRSEPDRIQPVVLGHGNNLSAARTIVKSLCRSLSC